MKIAIAGYGALGAATERAVSNYPDIELLGIFTRRSKTDIPNTYSASLYSFDSIEKYKGDIDVIINCMGSAYDLPKITPYLANSFNLVDSFDTHKLIRSHFEKTDVAAKSAGKLALVCAGWDPGLFSIARAYMRAVLPNGVNYTFWGEGVSRGHSNAVKQIAGVIDAVQYTVPVSSAVYSASNGEFPTLKDTDMHKRVCYIVAEPGADVERIEREIKTMPNYFEEYNTEVHFIDYESFLSEHTGAKHGGSVIGCDKSDNINSLMEFSLKLDSNPYFTAQILLSFSRAVKQMNDTGKCGCITVFDIKPRDLIPDGDYFSLI